MDGLTIKPKGEKRMNTIFAIIKTSWVEDEENKNIVFVTFSKEQAIKFVKEENAKRVFRVYSPEYDIEEVEIK